MQPACIRHTDLPGTSRLFGDFSYHFDRVAKYYRHDPHDPESFRRAAGEIDYPSERRTALVKALVAQNAGPAGPQQKLRDDALRKLAEPGTVAVVTGQQVGLFTGPAYTIYKALSAARLAQQLTERGLPAVPVFWLATEDHDFAEVNHCWMYDASGQSRLLRVDAPASSAGRPRPVGSLSLERAPMDDLRGVLKGMAFADEVIAAVDQAYVPGAGMGASFRTLLQTLTRNLGIIFLDPLDPAIRAITAPFMAKAVRASSEIKPRLIERSKELEAAGYHAQVHLDGRTSLFFLLENGERVPLRRDGAEVSELAGRAAELSPNALLRPVMQDFLLPTVAYLGGPGELAYLAQSEVLYDELLGRMPVAMGRSTFTLLDPHSAKLLDRYHLSVAQTFVPQNALADRVARCLVPPELHSSFETAAANIASDIDRLKIKLEAFDPTLSGALGTSRAKIVYQLEKMRGKTEREALRRDRQASAEADHLSAMLFPHRHLQERFYSILPFLAQHGMGLVDRLYDAVELDCPDHRVFQI
jgi:bacillithiol biosynthesis cysteine-adding enzyme BshC